MGFEATRTSHAAGKLSLIQRISDWTANTALFEQAWAVVCDSALNWWWSEQLCLFTAGAWTVFIYAECERQLFQFSVGMIKNRSHSNLNPSSPFYLIFWSYSSPTTDSARVGIHAAWPSSGHICRVQPILHRDAHLPTDYTNSRVIHVEE